MSSEQKDYRAYQLEKPYQVENIKPILAGNLRKFRETRYGNDKKQGKFGEELGLSSKTYSAYENVKEPRLPPLDTLLDMCNKMQIPVESLLRPDLPWDKIIELYENKGVEDKQEKHHVFSERRIYRLGQADIERALLAFSQILRPEEKVDQAGEGVVIHHKKYGDIHIDVERVNLLIGEVQYASRQMMSSKLRTFLDNQEKAVQAAQSGQKEKSLAEAMGIDYEAYKSLYEQFMALQESCGESIRSDFPLPFRSFTELMFIVYFTGADPLREISEALPKKDLYGEFVRAYDEMTEGRKAGGDVEDLRMKVSRLLRDAWNHSYRGARYNFYEHNGRQFSAVVEFNYLKILGVDMDLGLQLYEKAPRKLHSVLETFFMHLKDRTHVMRGHERDLEEGADIFPVDGKEQLERSIRQKLSGRA